MANLIIIESTKTTDFCSEAKIVLEANKYREVNPGTFSGSSPASTLAAKLKNLESYKKNKSRARIKITTK